MNATTNDTPANLTLLIARIVIVFGLIPNGLMKLAGFNKMALAMGGVPQVMGNGRQFPHPGLEPLFNFPLPHFFLAGSVTFDLLGALLVIIGLKARPVAGFLAAYCTTAMLIYHWDLLNPENLHSVMRTVPMFGGLMYIAVTGAGGWSVDAWLKRKNP